MNDDRQKEKTILLMKMFDGLILLRIGRELHEPYCSQFDERGYNKAYEYYNEEECANKLAKLILDSQLLEISQKYKSALRPWWDFFGRYFTYNSSKTELKLESIWPQLEKKIEAVRKKHGMATCGVLKAYRELKEDSKIWSRCDYNKLAYRAKELGGKDWRQALIALEVEGIVSKRGSGKRPGERSISVEVLPLVNSIISKWEKNANAFEKQSIVKPVTNYATELFRKLHPKIEKLEDPNIVEQIDFKLTSRAFEKAVAGYLKYLGFEVARNAGSGYNPDFIAAKQTPTSIILLGECQSEYPTPDHVCKVYTATGRLQKILNDERKGGRIQAVFITNQLHDVIPKGVYEEAKRSYVAILTPMEFGKLNEFKTRPMEVLDYITDLCRG